MKIVLVSVLLALAEGVTRKGKFMYCPKGPAPPPAGDINDMAQLDIWKMGDEKQYGQGFPKLKAGDSLKTTVTFSKKYLKVKDINDPNNFPRTKEWLRYTLTGDWCDEDGNPITSDDPYPYDIVEKWEVQACDQSDNSNHLVSLEQKTSFFSKSGSIRNGKLNNDREEMIQHGIEFDVTSGYQIICELCLTITLPDNFAGQWRPFSLADFTIAADEIGLADCPDSFVKGDPHFKTWSGHLYDFQGECDLVLVHAPNFGAGLGLDIHLRTTSRYGYSFTESAALRIGDEILEITSFGGYAINGVDSAFKGKDGLGAGAISDFPIYHTSEGTHKHIFDVAVSSAQNLTITTIKETVNVYLSVRNSNDFVGSVGLLGSFHRAKFEDGTMLARNGSTVIADPNRFGMEWQVHEDEPMLFRTSRLPQHPQNQCLFPTADATARRLESSEISRDEAEQACAHAAPEERKACVFDVLKTGDVDIVDEYD